MAYRTQMSAAGWPAPAKLNLFLHVLGRRDDGFHELQTLFQLVDLCDQVHLEPRDDGRIVRLEATPGVTEHDDLLVRAARLLREHARVDAGVGVRVQKRIPMGGGLGGGSSDAATVLVVLDRLWGTALSPEELAELGARLGADVPVFVRGHTALAGGIGEQLTPVSVEPAWYAIITPACTVPTGRVFADPSLTRNTPKTTIESFLLARDGMALRRVERAALLGRTRNDCEPVTRRLYPEVDAAARWLGERGAARMTGTGASVFAAFASEGAARGALAGLPAAWCGCVARGLDRSPLLDALAAR